MYSPFNKYEIVRTKQLKYGPDYQEEDIEEQNEVSSFRGSVHS